MTTSAPTNKYPVLFLGLPPDGYRVVYSINAHMDQGQRKWARGEARYRSITRSFHRGVAGDLTNQGARILKATPDRRLPDAVFAADCCLAFIGEDGVRRALMSKMRHGERKGEVDHWRRLLRNNQFITAESDCNREGSGDSLFDPNFGIWWTGTGKRTDVGAGRQQSEITGRPVLEIKTIDNHFYHLDTFLAFLPDNRVMVFKDAMTKADYEKLCCFYPDDRRLEMTKKEAMALGANVQFFSTMENGEEKHTIFVPKDCPSRFSEQLSSWGYNIRIVDTSGVGLAGGGTHCCFQRVWDLREFPLRELPQTFKDLLEIEGYKEMSYWPGAMDKKAPLSVQNPLHAMPNLV